MAIMEKEFLLNGYQIKCMEINKKRGGFLMNSYSILNKSIKVGGDEEKYLASLAEDNGRSIVSLVNDMKKVAEEAIVAYVEKLEVRRLNKGGEK